MNHNSFDKKYIYDIFHNDENKLIIIMPAECKPFPPHIEYINYNSNIGFKLIQDNHTFIYELLLKTTYIKNIQLLINDKIYDVNVNKYPEFKNEIIMSTLVYNEDNYIRQWINFHKNIGVTRFIIYDNKKINHNKSHEKYSDLKTVLDDFIKKGIVLLIDWPYPYRLNKSGISGQTTQQCHSMYAFRNSKYIGLLDIDEYVNMQNSTDINNFFNSLILKELIEISKIGSFQILNKVFVNPNNLSTNEYDFLLIYDCKKITKYNRPKHFVIPKNIETFSVHRITNGKKRYYINSKDIYFNHYIFLNKKTRGRDKTDLQDKTILKHCNFLQSKNID
jgi:hypothetical protein